MQLEKPVNVIQILKKTAQLNAKIHCTGRLDFFKATFPVCFSVRFLTQAWLHSKNVILQYQSAVVPSVIETSQFIDQSNYSSLRIIQTMSDMLDFFAHS